MKKRLIKNTVIVLVVFLLSYGLGFIIQNVFNIGEHITTLFAFSVFIISLLTDGYAYGIISSLVAVFVINYAFTYPYFGVDFSVSENIFSAIVMLIIAFLTSAFTTKLKKWQILKSEGEKERMRANLLRAVSHDLRTPLTTIYGTSSSIIDNYEKLSDTQKRQLVQNIKEDSEWLMHMVENLLSITRIDSGEVKITKTPTALDELVDSVVLKFKKRYPSQTIELDLPNEFVIIPMDAILIEQVLVNIFENAVHHAKGMTKISLKVFTLGQEAVFEISDDGCGIDKDKLENIFVGYGNKINESSNTNKRNVGIGLSVCATIIKAHGGNITAKNAKNGGAIFRFNLSTEEISYE